MREIKRSAIIMDFTVNTARLHWVKVAVLMNGVNVIYMLV